MTETVSKSLKIRVESVTKVFGPQPVAARKRLEEGISKDQIYRETGSVVAVADVSFEVAEGEIFVVMGLSGSGKSTLIRCLNRLIEPTSGKIHADGVDVLGADRKQLRKLRRTKICMVFQHFALFPHLTVGENAAYGLKVQGVSKKERRERALNALDQVGLRDWADTDPRNLSGGMQQRVGLARGLAVDSEILLMDEPFSALDPLIRRDMQQELLDLQERVHKTIVFITHDLNEALVLGDQIAIMKAGRFVQVGSPQEIVANPKDPYVAAFTRDVDRSRVFTLGAVMKEAPTLTEQSSLDQARAMLREAAVKAVYVLDREERPLGVIVAEDLEDTDGQDVRTAVRRHFPQAARGNILAECFELCASGLPIAVTDDEGRLRGTVDPLSIFDVLRPDESGAKEAEASHQE
jgi:glycine betaine/proline transport system ATP-binding protein